MSETENKHNWHWGRNLFLLVVFVVMLAYNGYNYGLGIEGLLNAFFATGFVWLITWPLTRKKK